VRLDVGQHVEQEVGEIAAEHLLEACTRRNGLRKRISLRLKWLRC
jgi:hypothetical protein